MNETAIKTKPSRLERMTAYWTDSCSCTIQSWWKAFGDDGATQETADYQDIIRVFTKEARIYFSDLRVRQMPEERTKQAPTS